MSEHSEKQEPKGILKEPKERRRDRNFQWDEMNILATYHPADKTYGHMKIDEPKTPFHYESADSCGVVAGCSIKPEDLAARLAEAAHAPLKLMQTDNDDVKCIDPIEEEHKRRFQEKRRAHYNEFLAVKNARDRLGNEDDDDNDDDEDDYDDAIGKEAARNTILNARITSVLPDHPMEDS